MAISALLFSSNPHIRSVAAVSRSAKALKYLFYMHFNIEKSVSKFVRHAFIITPRRAIARTTRRRKRADCAI